MNLDLRAFLRQSMIAAIYVVVLLIFHSISFGPIQFRVSEALMVLVLFNNKNLIGVTLGCFVANLIGGAIAIDVIFGTMATAIAGVLMIFTKNHVLVALFWPVIVNAIVIGLILAYAYEFGPFELMASSVFLGQFVVIYFLGLPLYLALRKNKSFIELVSS